MIDTETRLREDIVCNLVQPLKTLRRESSTIQRVARFHERLSWLPVQPIRFGLLRLSFL